MHRWLFVGLAIMAAVGGVGAALVSGQHPTNPSLGLELIAMAKDSSADGNVLQFGGDGGGGPFARPSIPDSEQLANLQKTAEQLQTERATRLRAIVDEYGWPGKRLVGHDGAHAAFELLRQVDDVAFQQRALDLMQRLRAGDVDKFDLAAQTDRVAVQRQQPQTYGTQVNCDYDTGEVVVAGGLIDEAHVDERRAAIGLPSLALDMKDARYKFGSCVADERFGPPVTAVVAPG